MYNEDNDNDNDNDNGNDEDEDEERVVTGNDQTVITTKNTKGCGIGQKERHINTQQ